MPAEEGVKVYVIWPPDELIDVEVRCVPAGESMAAAEKPSLASGLKCAVSVVDWPTLMLAELAEMLPVEGYATVIAVEAVAVPLAPVQLTEYEITWPAVGVTATLPLVAPPVENVFGGRLVDPVQLVALVELQVSVEEEPDAMLAGFAEMDAVGGLVQVMRASPLAPLPP